MNCPYCNKKFLSRHVPFCKNRDMKKTTDELRANYLIYNIPELFEYDKFIDIYINKKMSLPEIKLLYNIDFKNIQFMLRFYKIPIRGHSDGALNSMNKRIDTNLKKYGSVNVLSNGTEGYIKKNKTVKEKYGVENVFQIPDIINKINDNNYYLEKYGMTRSELISKNSKNFWNSISDKERKKIFKNFYSVETKIKIRETKIKNSTILSDDSISKFKLYKRNCRRLTKVNIKELFENWDGYDYYDRENIKDNLLLDNASPNYPTIDHKNSIFYGYTNGIKEEEICDINNLCITKRFINSSKGNKIFYEKKK